MPLLHRAQFVVNDIPDDLSPTDKVYYCEPTGEIFTEFEEYFERRVLLDTEVWSCSVTGKSNLTYDEAKESESAARKTLNQVDKTLCRAILYLFSKAPGRISAKNVSTEVFDAIKDKMMIGEVITHLKKKFKIVNVKPSKKSTKKDSDEENKSPDKKPTHYEYTIQNVDTSEEKVVGGSECLRKMAIGLNKLVHYLIKIHGTRSETNKSWSVTNRATKKFHLSAFEWLDHFPADQVEPKFEVIIPKEIKKKTPLSELSNGKEMKRKEKKISEKEKALAEEKRIAKEKAELEEKRKQVRLALIEWKKPKPDETLDDFMSSMLPEPKPIITHRIPGSMIGDVFSVIEFHRIFANAFGEMQFSSHLRQLSLGDMEQVLYSNVSTGIFCDMLFFYIQAIRYCHENEINEAEVMPITFPYQGNFRKNLDKEATEENEDENDDENVANIESEDMEVDTQSESSKANDELCWPIGEAHSPEDCVNLSTRAVLWSVKCLGRSTSGLQVDECTITEVIRVSLLVTAAEMIQPVKSYRKQVRGGWDNEENPFILALSEPLGVKVMRKMETTSVFEFEAEERLWLIKLLSDIVMCQSDGRQVIDDAEDEIKLARKHLFEGYKSEKQRGKDYIEKLNELETKAKEEENAEPDPVTMASSTRQRPAKKAKLTAREELNEFVNENDQMKEAQERQVKVLNEKLSKMELTLRAQLLGYDRFERRYWLMAGSPGLLVEVPSKSELPPMSNGKSWDHFKMAKQQSKPSLRTIKHDDSDDEPLAGLIKPKVEDVKMEQDEPTESKPSKWSLEPNLNESTRWFVYTTEAEVNLLLDGLNERGEREKELKSSIEKFASIIDVKDKSDYNFENVKIERTEVDQTHAQELSLRDYILDIEERIFNADFGDAFEDENERQLWRDYWTHGYLDPEKSKLSEKVIAIDFYDKIKDTLPPRLPLSMHMTPREPNDELRNLAASLIMLARALNKDFVLRPLGNKTKEKKKRKKNEGSEWTAFLLHQMKNWEMSVMNATSAGCLYLHVVHLDECINWDKSPENLRCHICKKKGDAQNMLICDECEKAFHTYCHKPKVKRIPEGDWFCKQCSIKQRQASSPVKKRRRTQADDDEVDPLLVSDRPRKRNKVNYAE